jgi:hypothetical protein
MFLGWAKGKQTPLYVSTHDMKLSAIIDGLMLYCNDMRKRVDGRLRAHARSGDAAMISGVGSATF